MENYQLALIGLGYVGLPLAVEFGKKIPTVGFDISFDNLAKVFNYKETYCATTIAELKDKIIDLKKSTGPSLLEVKINKGARKDLGRPTNSPIENKLAFMKYLNE